MMLRFAWIAFALLAACSDPGPRDRSLARRNETFPVHPDVYAARSSAARRAAVPSNVGLQIDELAPLYPADARLVIRCDDLAALHPHARVRMARLASLLPGWGLPELPPGTLLRVHAAVPEGVVVDRLHPFALVPTRDGWVALLPIEETIAESDSIRRVEGRYCVSGSPKAVAAYSPGGREGYFLPGDVSVMARGASVPAFGRQLTDAAALLKIALPGVADLPGDAFAGIDRLDLSLHCFEATVRADLRIVPSAERSGALAGLIGALDARRGTALEQLPAGGDLELAAGCDVASLLTLSTQLGAPLVEALEPAEWAMLERALSMLGDDTALRIRLDAEAMPTLQLVAKLTAPDRRAVATFLASDEWPAMLAQLGGAGHTLNYEPAGFAHAGIEVGTVGGSVSPTRLDAWRATGPWGNFRARLFGHDGGLHLVLTQDQLCITLGAEARGAMTNLLDRIHADAPQPGARTNGLRERPLLEASFDAATLLSLVRPHVLADARHRLPTRFAIATEGNALRFTSHLPLERIVEALTTRDAAAAAPPESDSAERD